MGAGGQHQRVAGAGTGTGFKANCGKGSCICVSLSSFSDLSSLFAPLFTFLNFFARPAGELISDCYLLSLV
ncbi:hypothetical protein Nepgr_003462 [Nepenthes gracilis]|uniref:Uncharacterized protein n=1 Tax=Nepenthes gracilis TaxID=150966 RepID=A0AAD3RZN2_NEPGR|nr:hypothetical protein Nepgr_003462 [Nepenthes gracilis]